MRMNTAAQLSRDPHKKTHEGAPAARITDLEALRRSVMACLLWEDTFYEGGVDIAERIKGLVSVIPDGKAIADLAVEARSEMNLRHVPLLIAREMARHPGHKKYVAGTLEKIIQRPDELTEFLAIYWADKRQPLSAQVKKGLAKAFGKFSEFSLSKYNRDTPVKLRDVLFLTHPRPKDAAQELLWKKLVDGQLAIPDTWEVALSSGADKGETFTRLLKEEKLGGLALLRNLRNMLKSGVDTRLIGEAIQGMDTRRILPFRFIAAARYAPRLEPALEDAMFRGIRESGVKFPGKTVLLVDVSGSMDDPLSRKSDMRRVDAACGLAMILREMCDELQVFSFSNATVEIPVRRGFALRDAITGSQLHGGTYLTTSIAEVNRKVAFDRIIVITDEQAAYEDRSIPGPKARGVMINVASYQNGVGYGPWLHLDGFSESVVRYLAALETADK